MSRDDSMIQILGTILSRLVNVALFIVITILALVFLRDSTELNLGVIALISIVIGIVGTIVLRYLFKGLLMLGDLFS